MKYRLLLLILLSTMFSELLLGKTYARNNARLLVENYIEAVISFCKKYDDSHRIFITTSLLEDPNINIGNDLEGYLNQKYQANWYFIDVKKLRVSLNYKPDFEIEEFTTEDGDTFLGAMVQKTVIYTNGKIEQYNELIALSKTNENTWKINNIASDLFKDITKYRRDSKKTETKEKQVSNSDCNVEQDASRAYKNGNFDKALKLYLQAQECTSDIIFIENRIDELERGQNLHSLFKSAEADFHNMAYEKALAKYQSIINVGIEKFDPEKVDVIGQRVAKCRQEIDLNRLIQNADYFFEKGAYNKALPLYEEAYKINPNIPILESRLADCKSKNQTETKQKQLAKINEAVNLIKRNKFNEGFSVLLRLKDTGYLTEEHLFYMAQILDTYPKSLRKEFGITKVDCCVLTKQFMVEARNLGASSEDFNFFWDSHFNEKSRSCIH